MEGVLEDVGGGYGCGGEVVDEEGFEFVFDEVVDDYVEGDFLCCIEGRIFF